ncbi:hypothetical protein [Frankia sp. CiP1_Cm_nod2]|uniref:hypothetical protein n=1 Tax=Frankia sp. CiP1_Cm_nod2 TaxID=2897161 RepID=UPI002024744A
MDVDRRDLLLAGAAGLALTGPGSGSEVSAFLDEMRAHAYRLVRAYPRRDVRQSADVARMHLRALTSMGRVSMSANAERGLFEAQAMYGAAYGLALADLGAYDQAGRVLDTAAGHAATIDSPVLLAHIAGTRALVALYDNRPGDALAAIGPGLAHGDGPAGSRLYGIAGRAYARLGDAAKADAALTAARRNVDQHAVSLVDAQPFRGLSPAELASYAVDAYARLGDARTAGAVADEWLPRADRAGNEALSVCLRAAYGMALAGSDPATGAHLVGEAIARASAVGTPATGVIERATAFVGRAPAGHAAVRDVAEMIRTLSV